MDPEAYQELFTAPTHFQRFAATSTYKTVPIDSRLNAGREHVQAIIDNATDISSQTEEILRSLEPDAHLPPITQRLKAKVVNIWNAFFTQVIKKDLATRPEGEDVLRFVIDLPNRISGTLNDGKACARTTIIAFLTQLFNHLAIEHDQFKLSARHQNLLRAVLHKHEAEGRVSTAPSREKQWASALLVSSLNKVQLRDAWENGTMSWDTTVTKCLGLSMMTATGMRAGDLFTSYDHADTAYNRLADIVIKITQSPDGQVIFRSRLTLRFVKGHKGDQSRNHVVALDSSIDPRHNSLDPVKFLLALTLRTGAVDASSIDQLVADTLSRPDRTVQWKHPDWPLLPAFKSRGAGVVPQTPAKSNQIGRVLDVAATRAGIDVHLISHDIRRGAARDASKLPSTSTQGIEGARRLLGHSIHTMLSGETEEYIGPWDISTWEARSMIQPDSDFDLVVNDNVTIPHRRRKRIDSFDPGPERVKRRSTTREPSEENDKDAADGSDDESANDTALMELFEWNTGSDSDNEFEYPDMQPKDSFQETIANNLVTMGIDLDVDSSASKIPQGSSGLKSARPEMFTADEHALAKTRTELLDLPSLEFIRKLSTINVTTKLRTDNLDHGNSRDPPSHYLYKCSKFADCPYEIENLAHLNIHEASCTAEKVAAAKYKAKSPEHSCSQCSYVATGKRPAFNLAEHVRKNHNFSKKCDYPGCNDQSVYTTADALRDHRDHHIYDHSKFVCPVAGCNRSKKPFATTQSFRNHLLGMEKMTNEQAAQCIQNTKW